MKAKQSEWFECKVSYVTIGEDGNDKKMKETYVVDAYTFTESEARLVDELSYYINGDYDILDMKIAPYKEIWFSEDSLDDRFYKAKIGFICIDEKTGKEKTSSSFFLVQANTFEKAVKNIIEVMKTSMADYLILEVKETKILNVVERKVDAE